MQSDMFRERKGAVGGAACVWCMCGVFTASSESEPGHRRNEDYVQIFDSVEHRTQRRNLFRNKVVRSVYHLAQHVPSPPPPFPCLTASASVSSSCLNFVLVLPKRSRTKVVPTGMQSATSAALSALHDFLPRTQLFCVKSFTRCPVCLS